MVSTNITINICNDFEIKFCLTALEFVCIDFLQQVKAECINYTLYKSYTTQGYLWKSHGHLPTLTPIIKVLKEQSSNHLAENTFCLLHDNKNITPFPGPTKHSKSFSVILFTINAYNIGKLHLKILILDNQKTFLWSNFNGTTFLRHCESIFTFFYCRFKGSLLWKQSQLKVYLVGVLELLVILHDLST